MIESQKWWFLDAQRCSANINVNGLFTRCLNYPLTLASSKAGILIHAPLEIQLGDIKHLSRETFKFSDDRRHENINRMVKLKVRVER